ncbi:hypothetical protein LINPERHAP1_LOCUS21955, partial [Linum perenne]
MRRRLLQFLQCQRRAATSDGVTIDSFSFLRRSSAASIPNSERSVTVFSSSLQLVRVLRITSHQLTIFPSFLLQPAGGSESVSRLPFFPAKAVRYSESTSFIFFPLFGSIIRTLSPVRQPLKWLITGGDGRATASASKLRQPKRKKNAPGSRRDPGWEYATDIDGDSKKTKCKFCSK